MVDWTFAVRDSHPLPSTGFDRRSPIIAKTRWPNPPKLLPWHTISAPVQAATSAVLNFLADPEGGIGLPTYNNDPTFLFDYHFAYPDIQAPVLTYREYRLSKFRVRILK